MPHLTYVNHRALSRHVEFDSPFRISHPSTVRDETLAYLETPVEGIYAPEVYHDDASDVTGFNRQTWRPLTGFTGQHGYDGAVLHASEQLDGSLARHILSEPGVYVVCTVDVLDDPEHPAGWVVLQHIA